MARTYTFSIPDDKIYLIDLIKKRAREEEKSTSELIVTVLEEYIKRHGQGNPSFPLDKWIENIEFKAFPTLGEKPNPKLLNTLDNDMLEEYSINAWEHYQAAKTEIRTRKSQGKWDRPYE